MAENSKKRPAFWVISTILARLFLLALFFIAIYFGISFFLFSSDEKFAALRTLLNLAPAPEAERAFVPFVWAQLLPDKMFKDEKYTGDAEPRLIARAIVSRGKACPEITIGGSVNTMRPRAPIYPTKFPITLCESRDSYLGTDAAVIGSRPLKPRVDSPKRILLIGDTGCRVTFYTFQHCADRVSDEKGWPFWKIARAASRAENIDLIIHVGDYHYRERACPANEQFACGTVDGGYIWEAWRADFFEPARALLAKAPWVFVRGNHENCKRAGAGWNDFFWPELHYELTKFCRDYHEPYVLELAANLSLLVLDVANSEDSKVRGHPTYTKREKLYKSWMDGLDNEDFKGSLWVAMQQPPWQWPESTVNNKDTPVASIRDDTMMGIQSYLTSDASSVDLVLAGDTHVFQALRPDDSNTKLPWVVVSGMGGTSLDEKSRFERILDTDGQTSNLKIKDSDQKPVLTAFAWFGFGYTILENREPDNKESPWQAHVFDEKGKEVYKCILTRKNGGGCKVWDS